MTRRTASEAGRSIERMEASAKAIPLESGTIDTVVTTWTLCTIPDVTRALTEMRRVLIPAGHLLFVEHGRSPDRHVIRWQDCLTPLWKRIGGGCHLNRPIDRLIETSGFKIEQIQAGYMKGPRFMTHVRRPCGGSLMKTDPAMDASPCSIPRWGI